MSILSDHYKRAVVEHTDKSGRCDLTKVIAAVKPHLTDEDRDRYVDRSMLIDAKGAATRGKASVRHHAAANTLSLFPELRRGYAIDGDETYIKNTDDLAQMEFKRVIDLRQTQVDHDANHVGKLEAAYKAALPIWSKHPNYTFGQCCKALAKHDNSKRAA